MTENKGNHPKNDNLTGIFIYNPQVSNRTRTAEKTLRNMAT